ncbi:MAG: class II fumarate hydratase [Clostridiales bacterium]|nr:class II fumarate hydratase [Clostridiales bacterium]
MKYRTEHDTLGEVRVPENKYWGAQTQRSKDNFKIGLEKMPLEVIRAFSVLKKAAAITNNKLGKLDDAKKDIILKVCDETFEGNLDENFPLSVWQTGSGTQTNMNVNEVVANRANEIAGRNAIHPNDHVNMSQSSNDTFTTAMNIAAVIKVEEELIPSLENIRDTFKKSEEYNRGIIKVGRTHLQDAVPIAFSQEVSAWRFMMERAIENIKLSIDSLRPLALGGTAVGTGLNSPAGFAEGVAAEIKRITGKEFHTSENKFYSLSSKSDFSLVHGALKALSTDLLKIANDIRWLASGPRCGIGEISIPENEPGSSIMPGKVNPTQCEALTMIVAQVMGNDTSISFGASQGNFQLNVFMPMIIYNFIQSVHLLTDGINSFNRNCASGIKPNIEKMQENLDQSLMLVTALNPYIGYEKSAAVAKLAHREGITLKEAVVKLGYLSEDEFDSIVDPKKMV